VSDRSRPERGGGDVNPTAIRAEQLATIELIYPAVGAGNSEGATAWCDTRVAGPVAAGSSSRRTARCARRRGSDGSMRVQDGADTRDVAVHGAACVSGRIEPQELDEPLHRDRPTRVEQKQAEQTPLTAPGEGQLLLT